MNYYSFFCQIFEALNVCFVTKVHIHTRIQKLFERVSCIFFLQGRGYMYFFQSRVVFFSQMAPHTQAEVLSSHWDRPYSREVAVFPAVCFHFELDF